jgi:hypothetical protein
MWLRITEPSVANNATGRPISIPCAPPDRARLAISMKLETAAFGYLRERWY